MGQFRYFHDKKDHHLGVSGVSVMSGICLSSEREMMGREGSGILELKEMI
jgi:hypothetical protein